MSGSRTEAPTPRRLRQARRRGEVARSAELSGAAALAAGVAALALHGPRLTEELLGLMRAALAGAVESGTTPSEAIRHAAGAVLQLALPVALAPLLAGAGASALLAGPIFSVEPLAPRLERVDPFRGLRRLLAPEQLLRAALGIAKAAVLLLLLGGWLREASPALAQLPRGAPGALLRAAPLLSGIAVRLVVAFAGFGLLDAALARARHLRALRMTKEEVRREAKEDEGDPSRRAERRRLHRALLEAGAVSRATVVVVNPTHLAVALRHDREGDDAPRVVAKGAGLAAARIRSVARLAGVPVVRDVTLARALHRLAEVGDEIPEELYEAAAAVLAHLYRSTETP